MHHHRVWLQVPIVKSIGLSLGLLIWGTANLVVGWGSGRFGWFGLHANPIQDPTLNTIGVLFAIASLGVSFFIQTTTKRVGSKGDSAAELDAEMAGSASASLLAHGVGSGDDDHSGRHHSVNAYEDADSDDGRAELRSRAKAGAAAASAAAESDSAEESSWVDALSPWQKRVFGIGASLLSGVFYGLNFDPPQYVLDHVDKYPGAPKQSIDYVFPHFVGIWLTSTIFLITYALLRRNQPAVFSTVIAPGFLSGIMWGIAQISWFVANANLSFSVTFPLISMGPGLVASLWGIFVFGEIRGLRNYLVLIACALIAAAGAVCIVISKGK